MHEQRHATFNLRGHDHGGRLRVRLAQGGGEGNGRARVGRAHELELVEGREYTTDEVYPRAAVNDLRFDARATIDPAYPAVIHAEITITNARNARRSIGFECGCDDVRLRLYASPERTSPPVWDSANRIPRELIESPRGARHFL